MQTAFGNFPATDAAWRERLETLRPDEYARSRNHLNGAVSYLSPYFTHGFLSLQDAVDQVRQRHRLQPDDKLFSEFAWRAFFHHVYEHLGGRILSDVREPLSGVSYQDALPDDIREGRTGLAVIDQAVGTLYETGYLHNHARMWLASYVVHLRHVHWRAGADWMYGHLLDGDLASNHLSWQWVASTFSSKPYLFNAENVAKYAPKAWHCFGTPLDTSYEHLEMMARGQDEEGRLTFEAMARQAARAVFAQSEPDLYVRPPEEYVSPLRGDENQLVERAISTGAVELVHPWALSAQSKVIPTNVEKSALRLGVFDVAGRTQHPWSERRWQFVLTRLQDVSDAVWVGDLASLLERFPAAMEIHVDDRLECLVSRRLLEARKVVWHRPDPMLTEPDRLCRSFSQFIRAAKPAAPRPFNSSVR